MRAFYGRLQYLQSMPSVGKPHRTFLSGKAVLPVPVLERSLLRVCRVDWKVQGWDEKQEDPQGGGYWNCLGIQR